MNVLPELKSGDVLLTRTGRKVIVRPVKRTQNLTAYHEPIYKLEYLEANGKRLTGNGRWTLEELNAAGMTLA